MGKNDTENIVDAVESYQATPAPTTPVHQNSGTNVVNNHDATLDERKRLERQKDRRIQLGIVALALVCLGVVLGVIFGLKDNKKEKIVVAARETKAPENATTPLTEFEVLLPNLPNSTLNSLLAEDSESPQIWAFEWLSSHPNISFLEEWRKMQLFSLATFYFAFRGETWFNNEGWLDYDRSECSWYSRQPPFPVVEQVAGICDEQGKFQTLSLGMNMASPSATMPPEIAFLTRLRSIHLPSNDISGRLQDMIPTELLQLRDLTVLDFGLNQLSGTIPTHLGLLFGITDLALFGNSLTGSIPTSLALLPNLTNLILDENSIWGSLPSELGLITSLESVHLFTNALSGPLPSELGLLTKLEALYLRENQLTGLLPSELGLITSLEMIDLFSNYLNGTLPSELGLLTKLEDLILGNNALTGLLPTQIGLLSSMSRLFLFENALLGPIPSELGVIETLDDLSLYDNELTGTIPWELGRLSRLRSLILYGNQLSGGIPSELGELSNMDILYLSSNGITGPIPSELALLTVLQILLLSENSLTGKLPSELGLLSNNLQELDLSKNALLTGSIPSEFGMLASDYSRLQYFNIDETSLVGTIPEEMCKLNSTECDSCILAFNCSALLCGCGCACPPAS
jgi:Leucine-rich repeat (LRR) protein